MNRVMGSRDRNSIQNLLRSGGTPVKSHGFKGQVLATQLMASLLFRSSATTPSPAPPRLMKTSVRDTHSPKGERASLPIRTLSSPHAD
jgi:hypothetical protein